MVFNIYQYIFFVFCRVGLPHSFQPLHRCLGIVAGENTLSSCFGCAMADAPNFQGNASVISVGRIDPGGQTKHRRVKERFRVIFHSHYIMESVFTSG